jgi:kynurenine formamidase
MRGSEVRSNWQGWASRAAGASDDEWIELSRILSTGMPKISYFPEPRFTRLLSLPGDSLNLTEMQMVVHVGTHIDAPCHFIAGGPSIDEVPFDRLHGRGVVWSLDGVRPDDVIEVSHLEACAPELERDEIVLIDTGWAAHFGSSMYDRHPSLSVGAARWLVEQRVKLVGMDTPTPDLPVNRRAAGFDWPVHHMLLSHGVLIVEHLTGLTELAGERIEAFILPLPIEGSDGSPVRAVARRLAHDSGLDSSTSSRSEAISEG